MLIDGLNLVEGSQVTNMVVESGSTFPDFPNSGELFLNPEKDFISIVEQNGQSLVASSMENLTFPNSPLSPLRIPLL